MPVSRCNGWISAWLALPAIRLQPRQQPRDLAHRGAHRRQHVALEFRIVGMDPALVSNIESWPETFLMS